MDYSSLRVCPKCGSPLPENWEICPVCRLAKTVVCPSCRHLTPLQDNCENCGEPLVIQCPNPFCIEEKRSCLKCRGSFPPLETAVD